MTYWLHQGRREKFQAPRQKFRWGPLVSGAPKSRDEQNKVITSADVRILARNKKKTSSRPQAVVWADEFCILNLTILNPRPSCVPGPPKNDHFCPPPLGGPGLHKCNVIISRNFKAIFGQILYHGFDSRLEPITFDIYTGWLLTRRAQTYFAISLNYCSIFSLMIWKITLVKRIGSCKTL